VRNWPPSDRPLTQAPRRIRALLDQYRRRLADLAKTIDSKRPSDRQLAIDKTGQFVHGGSSNDARPSLNLLGLIKWFSDHAGNHVASDPRVADHLMTGLVGRRPPALTEKPSRSLYGCCARSPQWCFPGRRGPLFRSLPWRLFANGLRDADRGVAEVVGSAYIGKPGVICCTAFKPAKTHFKI